MVVDSSAALSAFLALILSFLCSHQVLMAKATMSMTAKRLRTAALTAMASLSVRLEVDSTPDEDEEVFTGFEVVPFEEAAKDGE